VDYVWDKTAVDAKITGNVVFDGTTGTRTMTPSKTYDWVKSGLSTTTAYTFKITAKHRTVAIAN